MRNEGRRPQLEIDSCENIYIAVAVALTEPPSMYNFNRPDLPIFRKAISLSG